ncbi:hypothetical protein MsAg5_06640 [Methanosarcinaceae archaeon Ag5]|uniref:GLUG domain-containing protein n=1 Tax=Methanolapillus africanus TaxID=3028297 RepID=A0AAE4MJK2_9EURY|nr:hypothetical protein [Methanosarcinaceae archaeon Ag5]
MKNKSRFIFLSFLLLLICTAFIGVAAADTPFSGSGSGTAEDPYQIATAGQLDEIRNNLSASYILMNDLDLKEAGFSEWKPISGYWGEVFSGNFDGNNKTIRNMYIDDEEQNGAGLFADAIGSTISNLNFENATVNGGYFYAGVLSGTFSNGTIQNCTVRNSTVSGRFVGGLLIGHGFRGDVINCTAVDSKMTSLGNGGIVGHNVENKIKNCYVDNVSFEGGWAGGITGGTDYVSSNHTSSIDSCSATNITINVTGTFGGIAATSGNITIRNCYSDGIFVTDSDAYETGYYTNADVGGIVGGCYNTTIENCYTTATVKHKTSLGYTGGIVGNCTNTTITNCTALNKEVRRSVPEISFAAAQFKLYFKTGHIAGNAENSQITGCCYWKGTDTNWFASKNGQKVNSKDVWNTYPNSIWTGWDTTVWTMGPKENDKLPVLTGFPETSANTSFLMPKNG